MIKDNALLVWAVSVLVIALYLYAHPDIVTDAIGWLP
jgi:hypothetical protein